MRVMGTVAAVIALVEVGVVRAVAQRAGRMG
jgi:hypothetical protein